MREIRLDYSNTADFLSENELEYMSPFVAKAHEMLHNGTGAGNDFTGWLDLPGNYDRQEYDRVKKAADRIRSDSDALIIIGIGGSYLGARAAIDMLAHPFHNQVGDGPEIYYAGHNLSPTYLDALFEALGGKEISVNVISKSGTTTEPAVAFRLFREYMTKRYGREGAARRIYATTDRNTGLLRKIADAEGYESFVIPPDVGGRYSVLTPVGLLPMAACGIDTDGVMAGADEAARSFGEPSLFDNDCYMYAAIRNILYKKGYGIEVLAAYEPALDSLCQWWKQLFGESEGKDGKGIFPASMNLTTDLHSMGQYMQDGVRDVFETVINIDRPRRNITMERAAQDDDRLDYLAGLTLDDINKKAAEGTAMAHVDGGVPNMAITAEEMNAFCFGGLAYYFEKACGVSAYLLGVNPFDQPGVEAYKKNMFRLLGKG